MTVNLMRRVGARRMLGEQDVKSNNIELPERQIEAFCQRWNITELSLFGSVLRADFRPESDIDILVQFGDDARWTLLDLVDMQDELGRILGRPVDLVSKRGVEQSENWIRRKAILGSAQVVYGS